MKGGDKRQKKLEDTPAVMDPTLSSSHVIFVLSVTDPPLSFS